MPRRRRRVRIAREEYARSALTLSGLVLGLPFPILGTRMPAMTASKIDRVVALSSCDQQ
jgi:hypothetical protein